MRRAIIAALLLAGCQTTPAVIEPTPENVAAQFEVAAFGSDAGAGRGVITKWQSDPVLGSIETPEYDTYVRRYQSEIVSALESIQAVTGRRWITNATSVDDVTFHLSFMPKSEFGTLPIDDPDVLRFVSRQSCAGLVGYKKSTNEQFFALAVFGTDNSDEIIRDCILEEIYQAMGLPADACHYRPSVICEQDRVFELTEADKILLRTLYDPRLRPGMSKAEAMPIARQIIAEQMR